MTSGIQGPGGPGGPRGPGGPEGAGGPGDITGAGASLAAEVERLRAARGAGPAPPADLARLAADLDAGRITGDQALAEVIAGLGVDLGELDAAELRALVADLVATDPYLAGLAARLGGSGG
jgi:hypothetical protein